MSLKKAREASSGHRPLTQYDLMWIKFKRNRVAVLGGVVVALIILVLICADFIAPYSVSKKHSKHIYSPPQRVRFVSEGGLSRPFVYGYQTKIDMKTLTRSYVENKKQKYYIRFFVKGEEYKFLGLFKSRLHLFGVDDGGVIFLLGTDKFGQDLFSRTLSGARISLVAGLLGVLISLVIGSILGTISGYFGGTVDMVIQRVVEFLRSFPSIPLWMTLSAALPPQWSSLKVYFGIVTILAFLGWSGLCREVRAKVMAMRESEYVLAAEVSGTSTATIILKHILPNAISHIIVVATLAVPGMILGEASLSFLGLGIQPPMTSLGVLLQEAQNVRTIALHPWLFAPGAVIVIAILAFNFLGDGLRDAADPYSR